MPYSYIDTSALAKWYLPEAGSDTFAKWIQQQKDTCISSLTITEFRCRFRYICKMDSTTKRYLHQ